MVPSFAVVALEFVLRFGLFPSVNHCAEATVRGLDFHLCSILDPHSTMVLNVFSEGSMPFNRAFCTGMPA